MKNQIYLILLIFLAVSCKKEGYKPSVSNTVDMSGRWWVQFFQDTDKDGKITSADNLYISYEDYTMYALITSNTSGNTNDTVLITENPNLKSTLRLLFKFKSPVKIADLTFTASPNSPNLSIPGQSVSMISGKILKKAATTLSGAKADSIFVEMEFSDDPGTWYIYSGHRDTGQPEDQY